MSTQTAMVKAREIFEKFYFGTCTITEKQKTTNNVTHKTEYTDVEILSNEPCRLSHTTKTTSSKEGSITGVTKQTTLYIAPEHNIKAGSKIIVTQNGVTTAYEKSGEPAVYITHQSIPLSLWKDKT